MIWFAPLLAFAAVVQTPVPPPAPAPASATLAEMRGTAAGNRHFALDLYRRLARTERGNLFFSPISIAIAFGPTSAGARGPALEAMARMLHFPGEGPDLHRALGGLGRALLRDEEGLRVAIANTLWTGRSMTLRPAYLALTGEAYGAAVEQVDFSQAEAAAARINARIAEQTNGRITGLVDALAMPANTGMIITNAVYFLADWADPFDAEDTQPRPFAADGGRINVPTMSAMRDLVHYRGRGFSAVDLPYRGDGYVLTVLLPDRANGLAALEASLSPALLDRTFAALDGAEPVPVDLWLPKLELRTRYRLGQTLQAMGMAPAFGPAADFSGMTEMPARLSGVVHQTFLKMNEEGTEAAAATGNEIVLTGARRQPRPLLFHADHPFLLFLRERETGAILFIGRIVQPDPAPDAAGR